MQIRVRTNAKAFARRHEAYASQVPFATARGLTETARDVEKATTPHIQKKFDQPTPFTYRKPMVVQRATKRRLVAEVFFKDIQSDYLRIEQEGGERRPKGRALVIPVQQRVNRYGNMPRGAIQRLLARPDTFSGTINGTPGIWKRTRKGGVQLMVAYEPRARYEPIFDWYRLALRVGRERAGINFRVALRQALATAK